LCSRQGSAGQTQGIALNETKTQSDRGILSSQSGIRRRSIAKEGLIFDIKKYAVDDGPGIRTTIFLKGCPLRCKWCHNPESWSSKPQQSFQAEKCIGCGICIKACSNSAISIESGQAKTQTKKCALCGRCAAACPAGAKKLIGRYITSDELISLIEKDTIFHDQSGGGVTFSGGEPLLQHEFLSGILSECKNRRINTAVDTSCYAPNEILEKISENTDLFLCDLKHTDNNMHRKFTGVDNTVILKNIARLSGAGKKIIIRIPIVPGFNDAQSNIEQTGRFLSELPGVIRIDILPYHTGGISKSNRLSDDNHTETFERPSDELINAIVDKLRRFGLEVKQGG